MGNRMGRFRFEIKAWLQWTAVLFVFPVAGLSGAAVAMALSGALLAVLKPAPNTHDVSA